MQIEHIAYMSIPYHQRRLQLMMGSEGLDYTLNAAASHQPVCGLVRITVQVERHTEALLGWVDETDVIHPAVHIRESRSYNDQLVDRSVHYIYTGQGHISRLTDMLATLDAAHLMDADTIDTRCMGSYGTQFLASQQQEFDFLTSLNGAVRDGKAIQLDKCPPSVYQYASGSLADMHVMGTLMWRELGAAIAQPLFAGHTTTAQLEEIQMSPMTLIDVEEADALAALIGEAIGSWQFYQDVSLYQTNVSAVKQFTDSY